MPTSRKKLPIGIQSFKKMIEGNYTYVDKTRQIFDLISTGECYFLSRPRRFGKSLLLSTMKEIFKGNRALFRGLYIDNVDYDWQEHPVIHLSFTSVNSTSAQKLEKDIEYKLLQLAEEYGLDIREAPSLQTKFTTLIQKLGEKNRVVLLIDEYDYPLINNIDNLSLAESCRKTLHDFFVVLKDLDEYLRFIFITGVTKFSKTSIFSGLNNLDDLTLMSKASIILGYTHEELITNFLPYIEATATKQKSSKELVLSTMKDWYNGYQFSEASSADGESLKVYNPFSVLSFLSHQILLNYWAGTGTPLFLSHVIKTQDYPVTEIEGSEVNIDETKAFEIDQIKLLPLLWQTGYLTIDSFNPATLNYKLRYPNQEVKITFLTFFMGFLTTKELAVIKNYLVLLEAAMKEHDLNSFFKTLSVFFANVPYTMQLSHEKYYQTIFYIVLNLIGARVQAEEETNDGRIDAVIETTTHVYIFEFKLDEPASKALAQIEDKQYYQKYMLSKNKVVLIGVSFDTEKRNVAEWVSKDLKRE